MQGCIESDGRGEKGGTAVLGRSSGHSVLQGGDFRRDQGCLIDYKRMVLALYGSEVPVQLADRSSSPQVLRIALDTSIKLKPFTEAVVRGKVIGANGETVCVLLAQLNR